MSNAINRKMNEHSSIPPAISSVLCKPPQKKCCLLLDPESDIDEASNIRGKTHSQKQGSISITGEESVAKKVRNKVKMRKKKVR